MFYFCPLALSKLVTKTTGDTNITNISTCQWRIPRTRRNLGLDASRFQLLQQKKMKWKTEYCIWRSELSVHQQPSPTCKMSTGVKNSNPASVASHLNLNILLHKQFLNQTCIYFCVIKKTLIGCGCAKIRADWLNTVLSGQACAAGDKLFWSGLRLYLQSRWLAWFKIAPSQSGCSWKTRSVQGPTKTSTLTAVLYALMGPQNSIFELCNSFGTTRVTKK